MKKNYTFSNLPMAAIVLLIASLPCLAQASNESTSVLTVADNGATLALNNTSRVVSPSSASIEDTAVTAKSVESKSPSNLSAATFKVTDRFSVDSRLLTRTQVYSEVVAPDSKEQFRLDDATQTTTRKVAFVPSRGQKLPN